MYTGIVVFETNNQHPLDMVPLVYVTVPQTTWKDACTDAQFLASQRFREGIKEVADERTKEVLETAAFAIRNTSRYEYVLPTTVNSPGGEFICRIMVAESHP